MLVTTDRESMGRVMVAPAASRTLHCLWIGSSLEMRQIEQLRLQIRDAGYEIAVHRAFDRFAALVELSRRAFDVIMMELNQSASESGAVADIASAAPSTPLIGIVGNNSGPHCSSLQSVDFTINLNHTTAQSLIGTIQFAIRSRSARLSSLARRRVTALPAETPPRMITWHSGTVALMTSAPLIAAGIQTQIKKQETRRSCQLRF